MLTYWAKPQSTIRLHCKRISTHVAFVKHTSPTHFQINPWTSTKSFRADPAYGWDSLNLCGMSEWIDTISSQIFCTYLFNQKNIESQCDTRLPWWLPVNHPSQYSYPFTWSLGWLVWLALSDGTSISMMQAEAVSTWVLGFLPPPRGEMWSNLLEEGDPRRAELSDPSNLSWTLHPVHPSAECGC